jgi:putative membrane protein
MHPYLEYLDTFAKEANKGVDLREPKDSLWQRFGDFLGMPWAEKNPRRQIKMAQKPLGNLPLEILNHISGYIDSVIDNGTLKTPIFQVQSLTSITTMNDILTGCDRVLNTPLPLAYSIAISQITWVYILALPFQLIQKLQWKVIPATLVAAYIMLSIITIGREIENPFGDDVNDLPLEAYCDQITQDIDIITSSPSPRPDNFVKRAENTPLYPLSRSGYPAWAAGEVGDIRDALKSKVGMNFENHRHSHSHTTGREDSAV